ncbi:uncharacterized protein LOC142014918 [Carettochelys insculpta]|uniref:uncharacterized protein LOC142014918 n=1 Tax=Carettochelys insculpta TaxID=44489 RepID=UPI003EC08370
MVTRRAVCLAQEKLTSMTQDMGLEDKLPDLGGARELDQKNNSSGTWASHISELALSSTSKALLQSSTLPTGRRIKVESQAEGSKLEMAANLSSVPLKLKRGRPPKNKSVKQPNQEKMQAPSGTLKSRAGKLETKVLEPSLSSSKKSSENDSSLEKRKRGRPPKAQCVPVNPSSESPHKRGRPPKAQSSLVSPSAESSHKRGRPPKVAPTTELLRKRGRPPKAQSSLISHRTELPHKQGQPPKAAPSVELPHKQGQPPKAAPSVELPHKQSQLPKAAPSVELPHKQGQLPKAAPSVELPHKQDQPPKAAPSMELPHKQDQPLKATHSTEVPRKRGRPPKAQCSVVVPSAELPRKQDQLPKVALTTELPRKRGRPPKAQCSLVISSTDSPRKRGRPPKSKSLEKLSQGEAQLPSGTPKSHIRKLETKALELASPEGDTDSSESTSCLEKRKQGRPPKVHRTLVAPATDLSHQRHRSSKNKPSDINNREVQPSPDVSTPRVVKLEIKMPEPSSPRSRTSELQGEGEAQPSPSAPKPRAQKPGTSASEPASTSSRSKTVNSQNGCPLEKPRRGRPPKVPWAPAATSAESPSKRKRGQPSKSPAPPHMEVAAMCSGSVSDRDTSAENEPPFPGRKRRRRWRKEEPVQAGSESSLDSEDGMAPPWQKEKTEMGSETSTLLPPQNAIPEAEPDGISAGESSASEHPPSCSTRSTAAVSSSKTGLMSVSLRM